MTALTIYPENQPANGKHYAAFDDIQAQLEAIGVLFERWCAEGAPITAANQDSVLQAYQSSVNKLIRQFGFQSVDVMSLNPDHPDKAALRQKFLAEHTHDDFEVRFFIAGRGLFYLHVDAKVYLVLCEQGDLISVPANTRHWFDMGANPEFQCIRFFTTPDGWQAKFTSSAIAQEFPSFDTYVEQLAAA